MSVLYIETDKSPGSPYWRAQCDDARCSAYFITLSEPVAKDWDRNHWKEFHGYAVADSQA